MSQGGHSEPLLLLALFYQSTPSCLKVRIGGGGVGGPCDFGVSPSPFGLDFGTLGLWDFRLGLDNYENQSHFEIFTLTRCVRWASGSGADIQIILVRISSD